MSADEDQQQSEDPVARKSLARSPVPDEEIEAQENRKMRVAMKMVGSAMVFIGFLQVFLSVNTGAEISIFPMIIYFSGMALWSYSSVDTPSIRYAVIALSFLCAMAFMHFGEVLFWHKYAIYWGTVGMVVFFMFQSPKNPADS